jgi:hypothetical protein
VKRIKQAGLPSYLTPDDIMQVWKNFLKKYTIPRVERIAVADSLHPVHLPLGGLVCAVVLLPMAWWIHRRRADGLSFLVPLVVAMGVIVIGVLLHPYTRVRVPRPGSAASRISDDEGAAIVEDLLKNVYRAIDFRNEEDVYDKMALSASGDLLTELYLQTRKSFQVRQAGGAQAKVTKIDVLDVDVSSSSKGAHALKLRSRWKALGTVGHWGHVHTRQNRYDADIMIEPVDGAWKITDIDSLSGGLMLPCLRHRCRTVVGICRLLFRISRFES